MSNVSTKPVIILGAGGHAKVVADVLRLSGRTIIGVVDSNFKKETLCFGLCVLGADDTIEQYKCDDVELVNGVGSLPGNNDRLNLSQQMRTKGYKFATVIHPSAVVSESVKLNEGVQIMASCVVQADTIIGLDTIINTGSLIDHDCKIEGNCHIAPGVTLCGGIHVGDGTHIGAGSVVLQNITIGLNTVVAAGSVVYRNIENDTIFIQSK